MSDEKRIELKPGVYQLHIVLKGFHIRLPGVTVHTAAQGLIALNEALPSIDDVILPEWGDDE